MHRRQALKGLGAAAAGLLAARELEAAAAGGLERVGVGLFTIPTLLDADFAGAMELLGAIGYREVETFGPYPFSAPETIERWEAIAGLIGMKGSGYFGHTPQEVRAILDANGLSSPSMHTDLITLRTRMDDLAEAADVLGQRYVILPAIPEEERADLDAYRRLADVFDEIGESARERGLRFAYHNHGYGLAEMEGAIPLDVLLERTDPELVYLQMDLYWTVAGGADPIAYFERHPGRYKLLHVKDMSEQVRFSGDGGSPQQWFELFPYMRDAGAGVLDLGRILSAAKRSGVEHFLLERDRAAEPETTLRASYRHLAGLELPG